VKDAIIGCSDILEVVRDEFKEYDEIRRIERLYVPPEQMTQAENIISSQKW
jgi:hypothetical protein